MSDSYLVLWSADRCKLLQRAGEEGKALQVLFGGPHLSLPSFRRFKIAPGDWIYPVRLLAGAVYVLGRVRVARVLPLVEFAEQCPEFFAESRREQLCQTRYGKAIPYEELFLRSNRDERARLLLEQWLTYHPEKQYLSPTCTDEVMVGEAGTPICLDIAVPLEALQAMRFRSGRGERGLRRIVDGRLTSALDLQGGYYRLSEDSARSLERLLTDHFGVLPG